MINEYENLVLDERQTAWFCRGLLDLAAVDGEHENEIALVREFLLASESAVTLEELKASPFKLAEVAAVIDGPAAEAFIISCYMLVYADGIISDRETVRIAEYVTAMGISAERHKTLHEQARIFLLGNLAVGLRNVDLVSEIGSDLGLDETVINDTIKRED